MMFSFICRFIAEHNYKSTGQLQVVARHTDTSPSSCYEPVLIPGPLRWHVNKCLCNKRKGGMDLGSVNAPPLDHRDSGVGWSGPG